MERAIRSAGGARMNMDEQIGNLPEISEQKLREVGREMDRESDREMTIGERLVSRLERFVGELESVPPQSASDAVKSIKGVDSGSRLARVEQLSKLKENWDSYGAVPIPEQAVTKSMILARCLDSGLPTISASPNGSVYFDWGIGAVVVKSDGSAYIFDSEG